MTDDRRIETLLVGIDAACEGVLDPLIETGAVPNLASVLETGAAGRLESQIPPWTASAWPSLYTGVNPGKHGVFGFLGYDGYDWDVVDSTDVREPALWDILTHHGLTSVVVNVPVTSPPSTIDGAIVPGYTAPEEPRCHPDGLLEEIRGAIGEYRVYPDHDREQPDEYVDLVRMRGEAFRYLANRFEPDFGFVQFQQTDSVFHEYPGEEGYVEAIYRAVDEQLGAILDDYEVGTVIVASDHGMGPYDGYEFRVNEFLRDRGYLETTTDAKGMPTWLPILNDRLREGEGATDGDATAIARTANLAAKLGVTPGRVGRLLRTLGIEETVKRHVPIAARQAGTERVDFENSIAYARSRIELGVRLNVEGRDPNGTVPPGEYEAVRSELIELLQDVETPDGDPVFDEVIPREVYFDGPFADEGVDVVTVPADFDQFISADFKGELFGPPTEPYNHKLDGLVAIAGDGADTTAPLSDAHLFDVAPTVLASLDVPVSDRMDGDVLPAIGGVERSEYATVTPTQTESHANHDGVEDRLAALGYLEGNE